jgi:phosphoribosylaminoimidazole carboxylase PurE protein
MAQVYVVLGSKSDLEAIKASGMAEILGALGLTYSVSVCSAHRNLPELEEFTKRSMSEGAKVFIGVAGMATALPGALAGATKMTIPIIGVPMDEHGVDSCIYMPPGVPVLTAGVGKVGLKNAALAAAQILAQGDRAGGLSLNSYLSKNAKEPEFDINLEEVGA